jgi:hypothetical protein
MFFQNISLLTVVVAAIVSMGLGFVWYSQFIFGKRWIKETGNTEEFLKNTTSKKGMIRTYAVGTALSLITAYVVAVVLNSIVFVSLGGMLTVAFVLWLGFSFPVMVNAVLYGKDSIVLLAINSGYQLTSLVLTVLIIGIFG